MKQSILISIVLIILLGLCSSCKKNPLWVGNKEFVTFEYKFASGDEPQISAEPVNKSPFVEVGFTEASAMGNDVVKITVEGIRVFSKKNNYEIEEITISENDGNGWDEQNEFSSINSSESIAVDVATVLVLDMSSSLVELLPDLKTFANEFIDKIVEGTPDSKVAVIFFSSKDAISSTGFYTADTADELKTLVNNFNMSEDRTALFEATKRGIEMLDGLTDFEGEKSLVVFTDGGDNDTDNPTEVKNLIEGNEYFRISIGLDGSDFDKDDLKSIASSNSNAIEVKKAEDLGDAFTSVAGQVSSVYKIQYERSDQLLDKPIDIRFEFKVNKLK